MGLSALGMWTRGGGHLVLCRLGQVVMVEMRRCLAGRVGGDVLIGFAELVVSAALGGQASGLSTLPDLL